MVNSEEPRAIALILYNSITSDPAVTGSAGLPTTSLLCVLPDHFIEEVSGLIPVAIDLRSWSRTCVLAHASSRDRLEVGREWVQALRAADQNVEPTDGRDGAQHL